MTELYGGRRRWFFMALAIVLAGVLLRAGLTVTHGRVLETFEYETIADNLLSGRGFGLQHRGTWYRSFGSPPYVYLYAALYAAAGRGHGLLAVASWLFSGAAAMGSFAVGTRIFGAPAGVLAALLVAFHPGLLYYDVYKLHPLSFDAALFIWSVAPILGLTAFSRRGVLGAGVLHGIAVFERSAFVGLLLAALASLSSGTPRRVWRRCLLYGLGVSLALGPWVARSALVYGDLNLVSTSAELLWRGNNPVASGGAFARGHPGVPVFDMAPQDFRTRIFAADEQEQRRLFGGAAREFIAKHRAEALALFAHKLVGFWWFLPEAGAYYPRSYLEIYKWYYAIALCFAAVGLVSALRGPLPARHAAAIGVGLMMLVALVHAVFYVEVRHRWGIEPLVLTFSAGGALSTLSHVRSSLRASLSAADRGRRGP